MCAWNVSLGGVLSAQKVSLMVLFWSSMAKLLPTVKFPFCGKSEGAQAAKQ